MAHFVRRVLEGRPITFYGDGRQVRDLLFVDDLVRSMAAALERIDATRGRCFNMGGGPENAVSLREVVAMLGDLRGKPPLLSAAADDAQRDARRDSDGARPLTGMEELLEQEYRAATGTS